MRGHSGAENEPAPVILIAELDFAGKLSIVIHPGLSSVVESVDASYFQSLFLDFKERAMLHPSSLFKHLCSLGCGPLVTQAGGADIGLYPELVALRHTFVEL